MTVKEYLISEDLAGIGYSVLLQAVAPMADRFRIVLLGHKRHDELLKQLSDWLVDEQVVTEWPGTQMMGSTTAQLLTYQVTDESIGVLIRAAAGLYAWVNKSLPDDLHFLRPDGATLLGNVAHERDSWLFLTESEYQSLSSDNSPLRDGLRLREDHG